MQSGRISPIRYDDYPALLEPLAGARVISDGINRLNDYRVFKYAEARGLNIDGESIIVRNRLERYEMRRHFGPHIAPWNIEEDEAAPFDSATTRESPSPVMFGTLSERSSSMTAPHLSASRTASSAGLQYGAACQRLVLSGGLPTLLPTGQPLGPWPDSVSVGWLSHTVAGTFRPSTPQVPNLAIAPIEQRVRKTTRDALGLASGNNAINNQRRVRISDFVSVGAPGAPLQAPQAQSTRVLLSPVPSSRSDASLDTTEPSETRNPEIFEPIRETGLSESSDGRRPDPARRRSLWPTYEEETETRSPHPEQENAPLGDIPRPLPTRPSERRPLADIGRERPDFSAPASHTAGPRVPLEPDDTSRRGGGEGDYRDYGAGATTAGAGSARMSAPQYPPASSTGADAPGGFVPFYPYSSVHMTHGAEIPGQSSVPPASASAHRPYWTYPPGGSFPAFSQPPLGPEFTSPRSFFEHSSYEQASFVREKRTTDLLAKWHVEFKGSRRHEPEEFLCNLEECRNVHGMTFEDILKALPSILGENDIPWFRREYKGWRSYQEFVEAFRLEYCVEGFQERLRQAIEARTQGPHEDICTYLAKLRSLMDAVKPPMTIDEQLRRAHRNLHPAYRDWIQLHQIVSFADLQRRGKQEELRRAQNRAYKPPPTAEEFDFPAAAYVEEGRSKRSNRTAPIASFRDANATDVASESELEPRRSQVASVIAGRPVRPVGKTSGNPAAKEAKQSARTLPVSVGQSNPARDLPANRATRPTSAGNATRVSGGAQTESPSERRGSASTRKPVIIPPLPRGACIKCRKQGHSRQKCPEPIKCWGCGAPNIVIRDCPACEGYILQGNDQGELR